MAYSTMEANDYRYEPVLLIGNGKLAYSLSVCLLQAKHPIALFTDNPEEALNAIQQHLSDLDGDMSIPDISKLKIVNDLTPGIRHKLIIALTEEDIGFKKNLLEKLEKNAAADAIIGVNTESYPLSRLQENARNPERLFGMNWAEPVHTTFFLELIANAASNKAMADALFQTAKNFWSKDPYLIFNDCSIRAKMFSALVREAFYLVKNEYASIEDIDRACRNDPGYYLPFAGNCRYIDLMGAYAYGIVMKGLNPKLAKDAKMPEFLTHIIEGGGLGMENNKGFYDYENDEVERWDEVFRNFSYKINEIIKKYPFNYKTFNSHPDI